MGWFRNWGSSFGRYNAWKEPIEENGMRGCRGLMTFALLTATLCAGSGPVPTPAPQPARNGDDGSILLTVFLKHDQSKPLAKLNAELAEQGFYAAFPPQGVQVVSWYVMMGIGQVVTLRVPAARLREVNQVLETTAWGAYHTEFYPTYDYKAVGEQKHAEAMH
jgi:hypothetical protein